MVRTAVLSLMLVAFVVAAGAQPREQSPLDPQVIAAVNRLSPGFVETLQGRDSDALSQLAWTLFRHPGPDSATVLVWMLEHCPAWPIDDGWVLDQLDKLFRSTGKLPVAELTGVLKNADADHRAAAAFVLGAALNYLPPGDRDPLLKSLITALSDSNIHVREGAAGAVREFNRPEGNAALARTLAGADVTDILFFQATGRRRPPLDQGGRARDLPLSALAATAAIFSADLDTITTPDPISLRDNPALWDLLKAMQANRNPETTPVFVWLFLNTDARTYSSFIFALLSAAPYRAPIADLANAFASVDSDHRLAIVQQFTSALRLRFTQFAPAQWDIMNTVFLEGAQDPNIDVSLESINGLGLIRAQRAIPVLNAALDRPDATQRYVIQILRNLQSFQSQDALSIFERWARSGATRDIRETAAFGHLTLVRPTDPARETRRLLWEAPDTDLERTVLAQGPSALPRVWRTLTAGTASERQAAAALLGWFPDVNSVQPILAALPASAGAVTTNQLLFDLNMIALAKGSSPSADDRNALASLHLRWMYDQIANSGIDSDVRSIVLGHREIAVFPDRVVAPFAVDLSTRSLDMGQPAGTFSARAALSDSPEVFRQSVANDGCGVAFHTIAVADTVARVATTLYLPHGRIARQVWISLYRKEGNRWVALPVPSHPRLSIHRMSNEPNLMPTINRDYGADHPLKVLRLDLAMELVRVDVKQYGGFHNENIERQGRSEDLDASYSPLLEKYKQSDATSVKYTAELESARLTGEPNLEVWMDALAKLDAPFQAWAQGVISGYAVRQIEREGQTASAADRDELTAAALNPDPVAAPLLPPQRPNAQNIRQVQRSSRFGLVAVVFGSGSLGMSGYSMLFERRDGRWVFLCLTGGWIS